MSALTFDGDLTEINDQQLKYIKSVLENRGYTNNKVIIKPVGKPGDNYVANVKRIIVEDDKEGNLKMVAKIAPTNETIRSMANTDYLFRNEHIMYTKVFPKLTQLELKAEIPVEERFRYAKCYGSSDDKPNEVILLEDLSESNFALVDRFKGISSDCVKSVLKSFAQLHSLSYVLKYQEPEVFEEYKNSLFDAWAAINNRDEMKQYFKEVELNAHRIVENEIHKNAINGSLTGCFKDIVKMSKIEKDSKYAIIQQGDAWTNNILFKFDGETLLKSIMIDYQASKVTNPVADLLYMIFNCTDYETRKTNFYEWIDYYYTELEKCLSNHGLQANFVYPREQLDTDIKKYGKVYFGLSVLLAGFLTMKSEEASKMKKNIEVAEDIEHLATTKDPETIGLLRKRLEGLVDSCHELGLM